MLKDQPECLSSDAVRRPGLKPHMAFVERLTIFLPWALKMLPKRFMEKLRPSDFKKRWRCSCVPMRKRKAGSCISLLFAQTRYLTSTTYRKRSFFRLTVPLRTVHNWRHPRKTLHDAKVWQRDSTHSEVTRKQRSWGQDKGGCRGWIHLSRHTCSNLLLLTRSHLQSGDFGGHFGSKL